MKIVDHSFKILTEISPNCEKELRDLERIGKVCYDSKLSEDFEDTKKFIQNRIEQKHFGILEHKILSVLIRTSRGVTHELVRHRLASFMQESTRYCNYGKDKYDNQITVVNPIMIPELGSERYRVWYELQKHSEKAYMKLLKLGVSAQIARSVLTTSLKADIVITANWREWRHILNLRTAPDAHPEVRALMTSLHNEIKKVIPVVFDTLGGDDY